MLRTFLMLVLLSMGLSGQVFGCSCVSGRSACESLRSDAAFVGRVIETVATQHQREKGTWSAGYSMRFAVDETLHGVVGTEVMIETGLGGGDCGTPLPRGHKYLIFAYKNPNGELWSGLCSGNRDLTDNPDAEKLVEQLRNLVKKGSNTIFGSVVFKKVSSENDGISGSSAPQPMKGLTLHAVSDGYSTFTQTRADGKFEFEGLPDGKYRIIPELPSGVDFDHKYEENRQPAISGGACANVNFWLQPVTRIRGRLILPPGYSHESIKVVAAPVQLKKPKQFSGNWDFTDQDDHFDLWPLPPGDYYVGVNINSSPKEDSPFPPTYYPGVTSEKAAHIVHVDEGEIKELELALPEVAAPRTVNFVAIGLDGKPMRHVYVQREDLRHRGEAASYVNVDLGRNGSGSMIVYAGYSYHLHASQWISSGNEWCAKPVMISAGTEPVTVRFIMDRKSDNCSIDEMDGIDK